MRGTLAEGLAHTHIRTLHPSPDPLSFSLGSLGLPSCTAVEQLCLGSRASGQGLQGLRISRSGCPRSQSRKSSYDEGSHTQNRKGSYDEDTHTSTQLEIRLYQFNTCLIHVYVVSSMT